MSTLIVAAWKWKISLQGDDTHREMIPTRQLFGNRSLSCAKRLHSIPSG